MIHWGHLTRGTDGAPEGPACVSDLYLRPDNVRQSHWSSVNLFVSNRLYNLHNDRELSALVGFVDELVSFSADMSPSLI